jgi:uncharacterized membrane protein
MTEQRRGPTRDQRLVSAALRIGVGIAAAFCAIGALLYFIHHGAEPARYSVFVPARFTPGTSGLGLMTLGVLILLATPVVRVTLLIFVFAREHDWLYSLVSGVVLGVLILGLHG